ncbi:MAG TPA: T9SS type A sorting domain-containing protein [Ferruginibacter sp.]|nr:T9SS type A sorting domain-containing protein [Ferruginibacter sp.]
MKKIFTLVVVCFAVLNAFAQIESCPAGTNLNAIPKFPGVPSLVSGSPLQEGAVYKYNNVVTVPLNMYALVTIVDIDNAVLVGIDERDLINQSNDDRFQPQIKPDQATLTGDRRGVVTFKMTFYNTLTNLQFPLAALKFTHYDMDGTTNGSTGWFREIGCLTNEDFILTSLIPLTTLLNGGSYNQNGLLWKLFYGSTVEHDGVSSDPEVALVSRYLLASSVTFKMGYDFKKGNGGNFTSPAFRQYAAKFGCFTFLNGSPLPVKYLSFDAVVNDKTVLLKWLTTEEVNNDHFEVERSFDMNNYSNIGLVLDGFVNGANKSYQFKDNSSELQGRSIVYYRLKQFDIDGKFTYSKVLAVRLQPKANTVMQVSPNPFIENLNVRFTSTETGVAQIRIINATGQTLLSKQTTISKGYNNIQIDALSGLATGMYVAQLVMNGTVIDNQRVIKNPF